MSSITIHDKHFVPYLTNEELQKAIKDLAEKVYEDYKDEVPVFIGVLNGVFMFFSDFMKYYPGRCEVAFLQVSSYNGGLQSTGIVNQRCRGQTHYPDGGHRRYRKYDRKSFGIFQKHTPSEIPKNSFSAAKTRSFQEKFPS